MNKHRQTRGFRVVTRAFALAAIAASAIASTASAAVVYDNIATPQPGNVASLGYEATSTSEWGGQVELAGTARKDPKVTVLMSSWGCQSGGGTTCVTAPGATFTHPITLKLYKVNADQSPGALVASDTRAFAIPFRPSAELTHCPGGQWYDAAEETCYNGYATPITFNLSGEGITLPDNVIATVAYNTSHRGYLPLGPQACAANCGYDSLNVGAETAGPTIGSIPAAVTEGTYWATTHGPFYCDAGAGGVGTLRLDNCGWAPNQPSFRVSASDTEGSTGPTGPVGPAGTAGTAGAAAAAASTSSLATIALKRKMAITFSKGTVAVSDDGTAAVPVRCSGSVAQRCVGTLTLKAQGTIQKAVYSVVRGQSATVPVHLGAALRSTLSGASEGVTARAVARTEQDAGRPFRTARRVVLK